MKKLFRAWLFRFLQMSDRYQLNGLCALVCTVLPQGWKDLFSRAQQEQEIGPVCAENQSLLAQNILYVDVTFLKQFDHKTGIQRVVRSLLQALLKDPPSGYRVEPVCAFTLTQGFYFARVFAKGFEAYAAPVYRDERITPKAGDRFLGLDFSSVSIIHQAPYLKTMHEKGVHISFVVYDLIPLLKPASFPVEAKETFEKWLTVVAQCDEILCISQAVSKELQHYLQQYDGRMPHIQWFHLGADIENSLPTQGMPEQGVQFLERCRKHPSFLMVSTIEPRKGHAQALSAFEKIWAQGVDAQLVMIGKQGWQVETFVEKIRQHPEWNCRLFWLEDVSDQFLAQLYEASTCFLSTSEAEGFGLPLIEAAKYQLPVLARDLPVFQEIMGKHAYYFSGQSAEALRDAILCWMKLHQRAQHPTSVGLRWLTWSESAMQLKERLGFVAPA